MTSIPGGFVWKIGHTTKFAMTVRVGCGKVLCKRVYGIHCSVSFLWKVIIVVNAFVESCCFCGERAMPRMHIDSDSNSAKSNLLYKQGLAGRSSSFQSTHLRGDAFIVVFSKASNVHVKLRERGRPS